MSSTATLFKIGASRADSSLVYQAQFFPLVQLRAPHRLVWNRQTVMTKEELLSHCNSELTHITLEGKGNLVFPLSWQYNAVPTKIEWDKLSADTVLLVEAKISPLIPGGRTANLSFPARNHFAGCYSRNFA